MPKKPKEDRSDWVAVEPEFSCEDTAGSTPIRKAASAYQFFQRHVSAVVKEEITASGEHFDIAKHGRAVRDRWNSLSEAEKEPYYEQARADKVRFAQESHAADVAAIERKERMQKEHNQLFLYEDDNDFVLGDEDDDDDDYAAPRQRTTRNKWNKKLKKKMKLERKKLKGKKRGKLRLDEDDDEEEYQEGDDDDDENGGSGSWDSNAVSSDDDDSSDSEKKIRKKKPLQKRVISQKQIENREKIKQEKIEKEAYIASRQDGIRKEHANQAKRRLEFLLKQSNIFSHFGCVKEETAKYGISSSTKKETTDEVTGKNNLDESSGGTRRGKACYQDDNNEDDVAKALEEADEHEATYLTQQPSTLGFGQMREYQLEGLNWMIGLQENGVNGILADEMGLGKTLQSISILVYMMEYQKNTGPHLIIVPKSTLSNWMNELSRWAPTLTSVKFHGGKEEREDFIKKMLEPAHRDENRTWNVLVTTYEIINIEKSSLLKFAWSYLIVDEAHRLKNEASMFSKTVRMFETRYRVLLTGTPLQNSLHELWALLNFLVPDVFASSEQFDEWFNLDIDDDDEKNKLISQLHKILRPFMLRRLKADVEKSLPPKHETILFTGMSAMQKKLYRDILIRDIDAIQGSSGSRTAILNIVMQLRKCAGHPYLFPGVEDRTLPPLGEHLVENCGKMVVLDKLLKRLYERGHRVLLFTQMTKIIDIMEDYLVMRKYKYCRIDGNTSYDDRENFIEAFNAPDSEKFLFLLSTRAGGLGINLQTADVVILYDSDWNPQADLQAQDRAHRIGQKKPVQVFRLVTEHTVEEKIVERAQQKLKLDAMVVQSGRLKDKDSKLSRDELLAAVRFGADRIFKSKDSSITDDDIDLILDVGKRKTQELNEKLRMAEKGDLLDFKLDGSSVQTFEGVDYSRGALAQAAKSDAAILGIFDIGKRERKEANYNENSLYHRQITALQGERKPKAKKAHKLPKHLRLPRMEEWQMFDREKLLKIQEEEEAAFQALPEDQQKLANTKDNKGLDEAPTSENSDHINLENIVNVGDMQEGNESNSEAVFPFVILPPFISEEKQLEKERLLKEGFSDWSRHDYTIFIKASAKYGRDAIEKIALEVGKSEVAVKEYAAAFWGEIGRVRVAEHEYDRVVKMVERGEKKIGEIKSLERATKILVSHFNNPWNELEFIHVNCKDKMFTAQEDRHLLCWSRKYGYGQWMAIKLAARRNPNFRFDYFLRSLPVDLLARRCEQLMKAAEKEVEQLERRARELAGLPTEPVDEKSQLPPIEIPKFRVLQKQRRKDAKIQAERDRKELEEKVAEIEAQIQLAQDKLKALNEGTVFFPAQDKDEAIPSSEKLKPILSRVEDNSGAEPSNVASVARSLKDDKNGATVGERFIEFPQYDGIEHPAEWKKPFTHFCNQTRRVIKSQLDSSERKDKNKINTLLKERWLELTDEEKMSFREWTEWDKKRFAHELEIFQNRRAGEDEVYQTAADDMQEIHIPKKRKQSGVASPPAIPKKKRP